MNDDILFDRLQIMTGQIDGESVFVVYDLDLDITVARGDLIEMQNYLEARVDGDKMKLWQ